MFQTSCFGLTNTMMSCKTSPAEWTRVHLWRQSMLASVCHRRLLTLICPWKSNNRSIALSYVNAQMTFHPVLCSSESREMEHEDSPLDWTPWIIWLTAAVRRTCREPLMLNVTVYEQETLTFNAARTRQKRNHASHQLSVETWLIFG